MLTTKVCLSIFSSYLIGSKSNFGNTQGDSDDLAKRQRRDASSDRQRRTPSSKYSTSVSNPQKIRSSDRFSTKWNWEAIFLTLNHKFG